MKNKDKGSCGFDFGLHKTPVYQLKAKSSPVLLPLVQSCQSGSLSWFVSQQQVPLVAVCNGQRGLCLHGLPKCPELLDAVRYIE